MVEPAIKRRDFLKASAWASALFAAAPFWAGDLDETMPANYLPSAPADLPLEWTTPSDLASVDPAVLVLNRIAFGPRPREVKRIQRAGVDSYVESQLHPETIDDRAVDDLLSHFPTLGMSIPELVTHYPPPGEATGRTGRGINLASALRGFVTLLSGPGGGGSVAIDNRLLAVLELIEATLLRQVYSERQFLELMVDFWSNHFNIYILKSDCRLLKVWDDREVIRKHALGKFRDLLFATAHSPAMLIFLDNVSNQRGIPQENYARELMELHTLGVDGGFAQSDVAEVARCFTGWSVVLPRPKLLRTEYDAVGDFEFNAKRHDDGDKTVLGVKLPAHGGVRDGEQVLELLANHPKTAEHICEKLVRRFVDDQPPATLVTRAVETFTLSDGDIRAVMSTILHSDEFKTSFGRKVKRPLEFIAAALRAVDALPTDPALRESLLNGKPRASLPRRRPVEPIARSLRTLGQVPFMWQAPNGYPDAAGAWVNTNNLLTRWNFALALTTNRLLECQLALDNSSATAPDELVDFWSQRILSRALPAADRTKLVQYVKGTRMVARSENLVALLLASPHFQYR